MKTTRKLMCLVLALVLLTSTLLLPAAADDSKMIAQAKKGVAQILTIVYQGDKSSGVPIIACTGTGFAVGIAGEDSNIFVTNWHVATCEGYDLTQVRVYLLLDNWTFDASTLTLTNAVECEVLYTTSDNLGNPDYAILRTMQDVEGFEALPLRASEDVASGTTVYALGYPAVITGLNSASGSGIDDITVTSGVVSQHMEMKVTNSQTVSVLVHDAQITSGNSGGPLLDSDGYVIGVNTYGLGNNDENDQYGAAINTSYIMDRLDLLRIEYSTDKNSGFNTMTLVYILLGVIIVAAIAVIVVMLAKPKAKVFLVGADGSKTPVTQKEMRIGCAADCQIRLPSGMPGVSRNHCSVRADKDGVVVTDHSSYGTYIGGYPNGSRLAKEQPTRVPKGATIYLASKDAKFTVC